MLSWKGPKGLGEQRRFMPHAGVFVEAEAKILLLHRVSGDFMGGTWCIPGGRGLGQPVESPEQGAIRELKEETRIEIGIIGLQFFDRAWIEDYMERGDVKYSMYRLPLTTIPKVTMDKHHDGFAWVTPETALEMKLMPFGAECIMRYAARRR